jgi:hypothetical protein
MNSLSEESESNLNPREIKTSPKDKRANTLNERVKGEKRVGN